MNDKLDNTARVAEEALGTQNHVQGELYRQRGVIEGNIDKVALYLMQTKDIKGEIKKAGKKTN